eukprot:766408-Hanusia_phi.AAC.4
MYQPMGMRRSQESSQMGKEMLIEMAESMMQEMLGKILVYRERHESAASKSSIFAGKAGVGLLFMMTPESPPKIMVKEIVHGGSAWRNGQVGIKPGDVIVQVGNTNVQNSPLSHLRELILGEPGTWITLGFQRGSTGEFYETSMIRGTQDFLDKHTSMPTMSSIPREAQPHGQSSQPIQSSNLQVQQQANEIMSRKPTQYTSRDQEEYDRMRTVLNTSQLQTENAILRSNLKTHELQNDRNGEELRGFREALERKEEEGRRLKAEDDRAKQISSAGMTGKGIASLVQLKGTSTFRTRWQVTLLLSVASLTAVCAV